MKKISAEAYQALREALAVITWHKRPFQTMLRTFLRDSPELLAGLNFDDTKRAVVDELVDRLLSDERRWHEATLQLMVEVGSMTRFPNLESLSDSIDREFQLSRARAAVADLNALTKTYAAETAESVKQAANRKAQAARAEATRRFADEIDALRQRFVSMQSMEDAHKRGYDFEKLLNVLFMLFDMEPRLAYKLDREQIDGSLTFDTDDYILEARWRKEQVSRGDADVFAAKVNRKGKNALGLIVSVNGFTSDSLEEYKSSTPFLTMDGADLYMVLDQRVRLDDLLQAKKRHANETGSCHFPAMQLIS